MKAMTEMENAVMLRTNCDRQTANLVVNAVLDIDRRTEQELADKETIQGAERSVGMSYAARIDAVRITQQARAGKD